MSKHRIRLAGPWEFQEIDVHHVATGETVRCQLPFSLSEPRMEYGVQLIRGFHHPTGVDEKTRLRIVLQMSQRPLAVRINGNDIVECDGSTDGEHAFDITDQINSFNELRVLFGTVQSNSAATLNTVWLEIER